MTRTWGLKGMLPMLLHPIIMILTFNNYFKLLRLLSRMALWAKSYQLLPQLYGVLAKSDMALAMGPTFLCYIFFTEAY